MRVAPVAPATRLITGDELFEMGDIGPCELVEGRIVPMSPSGGEHGVITFLIGSVLTQFVRARKLGWILGGETGVYTRRNPDTVRGMDVAFLSKQRAPQGPGKKYLTIAPELVVEVISPSNRWSEIRQKIDEYFSIGVERVWVVEPDERSVLVYRAANSFEKLNVDDTLSGEGLLSDFVLPIADLFADEDGV